LHMPYGINVESLRNVSLQMEKSKLVRDISETHA